MPYKTQKEFVDYGYGFPVVMEDVPMVLVRGIWTPDVDYGERLERSLVHGRHEVCDILESRIHV